MNNPDLPSIQNPVTEIVVIEQSDVLLAAEHFALTATGLRVIGEPSFDECQYEFINLTKFSGVINLAMGDLLNYVELVYGETYAQLETYWGKDVSQLYNFKYVAGKVPLLWREAFSANNENHRAPSYTLCKHAAAIQDDEERNYLIAQASVSNWNSTRVKAEVDKLNGKPAPSRAELLQREIGHLTAIAEQFPSIRRDVNKAIKILEALL